MTGQVLGPLQLDPSMPDAGKPDGRNFHYMQHHLAWVKMTAAYSALRGGRWFASGFNLLVERDTSNLIEMIVMENGEIAFAWTFVWENVGGGNRIKTVYWFLEKGTGHPPVEPPAGAPKPIEVLVSGGGLSYMGRFDHVYADNTPNNPMQMVWVGA